MRLFAVSLALAISFRVIWNHESHWRRFYRISFCLYTSFSLFFCLFLFCFFFLQQAISICCRCHCSAAIATVLTSSHCTHFFSSSSACCYSSFRYLEGNGTRLIIDQLLHITEFYVQLSVHLSLSTALPTLLNITTNLTSHWTCTNLLNSIVFIFKKLDILNSL